MLAILIGFSFLIMLASLVGVYTVWSGVGRVIERNLGYLVSFSAGVFILIAFELSAESLELSVSIPSGLLWIGIGAIFVWMASRLIPTFHHHHTKDSNHHEHSPIDARRILISDAFHNVGDGILLAASFAINTGFGITVALSVFFHELVQELSEFFVLRQAGLSSHRALKLNFLVSATILIGAVGGYFLLESFEALEAPLLGLAAGSLLVVVLYDLIPHSVRSSKTLRHRMVHIGWFLLGLLVMASVLSIAPEHGYGEDEISAPFAEHSNTRSL